MPDTAVITLREVYDAVQDLSSKLSMAPVMLTDHESRIRRIEARLWQIGGGAVVLGALFGNWIPELLNK